MKKRTVIILISLLVIICGVLLFLQMKPPVLNWLTVRLYLGNRATVDMHVTVDGEAASVSRNGGDGFMLKGKAGEYTLTAKASDYDNYTYGLMIEGKNGDTYPIKLIYQHWNWWEILKDELTINVDSSSKAIIVNEKYNVTLEELDGEGNSNYFYKSGTKPGIRLPIDQNAEIYIGY